MLDFRKRLVEHINKNGGNATYVTAEDLQKDAALEKITCWHDECAIDQPRGGESE